LSTPIYSFVVPLYNESDSFSKLVERLNAIMKVVPFEMEAVLIDDGSKDQTPELMRVLALQDNQYQCVFLARNYGHQIALSAGLKHARGEKAVMVIDGDLQDPPELFADFLAEFDKGYDVVYAVRKKRKEGMVKKTFYSLFYHVLKSISYIDLPIDSGDFSLISRRVVDVINQMPEESRFIRGMRAWVGFKQTGLEYERQERYAGTPKYDFKMLFRLAYNGIFNFSEFPVKFISVLGMLSVSISILYFFVSLYLKMKGHNVPGFTGLLFTIILFGGVQLISIGVLGEYLLRIFFQSKQRPLFVIKEIILDKKTIN
jgi:dolichol-phosphate mannosyltransferase